MNLDFQFKVQAYVDGELSAAEAAAVETRLAQDAGARALLAELRNTHAALASYEVAIKLPESREFYWSKIEREISRSAQPVRPVAKVSWFAWVNRHLLPVGGVTALACLLAVVSLHTKPAAQFAEMELAGDDMGAYTFRDHQEKMTMVWFYDRTADSEFTEPAALATVDTE